MSKLLSFFRRHKILTALGVLVIAALLFFYSLRRGPYHNYELDFILPAAEASVTPGQLEVGVAIRDVTPDMSQYDTWEDTTGTGRWDRKEDRIIKRTDSRRFQPAWLAGFQVWRPAKGVNNEQWVRAIALRNNGVTVVMVTIDSVGIYHNDYITIRKMVSPTLDIDHILFSATHSHSTICTMKLWSGNIPVLGYDDRYMKMLQQKAKEAIEEAYHNLQPADMHCVTVEVPVEGFIHDSRKPVVFDKHMYLWRFTKPWTDETIATFVNWGNHPEVQDGRNHYLSSDFPHWLRLGLEQGVPNPNGVEGFGGVALYFQGMIGGLMNPLRIDVPHRNGIHVFSERTFEKTESLGYNLAIIAANALRGDEVWHNENPFLSISARTIKAPMAGLFRYGIMLGLIHEGYYWGGYAKSEINVLRIGDVLVLTAPGEIYPEIVLGGIEAKPGRDFEIPPQEVPPLMDEMTRHARQAFVVGVANDEIGYIIPKSQWDTKPPHVYGDRPQYGEMNSGGPDVAPTIHRKSLEMLRAMNESFETIPPADDIEVAVAQPTGLPFLETAQDN